MVVKGEDITKENYIELISELFAADSASSGLLKNDGVAVFLKEWFE